MNIVKNLTGVIVLYLAISTLFVSILFITAAYIGTGINLWWYSFFVVLLTAIIFVSFRKNIFVQSPPKTFTLYSDPFFTKIVDGVEYFIEIPPSSYAAVFPYWNYYGEIGIESDINFEVPISLELKNAVIDSKITVRLSIRTDPGYPSIHAAIDKDETKRQQQVQEIIGKLVIVVTAAHLQDKAWQEVKEKQVLIQDEIKKLIENQDGIIQKECERLGVELNSYVLGDFELSEGMKKAINFVGIAEENAKAIRTLVNETEMSEPEARRYLLTVTDEHVAYDLNIKGLENLHHLELPSGVHMGGKTQNKKKGTK
ncbi:hypothetical protein GW764_00010 [Candidatus Parcubacteria bacterium]|nr:hypothetical protein [Candidatus Parcubacteria bacterium]